jgi:hypothetical protein
VFSKVQLFRKGVGLGSLFATALAISFLDPSSWGDHWSKGTLGELLTAKSGARANLAFVQALVCVVLALLTPQAKFWKRSQESDLRFQIATRACDRIRLYLVVLFFFWALYYLATGAVLLLHKQTGLPARAFLITLSTTTSLILYWLYLEMSELTQEEAIQETGVSTSSTPTSSDFAPHPPTRELTSYKAISVGIFVLASGFCWLGAAISEPKVVDAVDLGVALFSGVGLCLVVGRLGSKLLDPGPVTLSLLYLYAVIQLGAAYFSTDDVASVMVTTLALPLKLLFWLVCVWAFTSGVLGEYVYELRLLIEHVGRYRAGAGAHVWQSLDEHID